MTVATSYMERILMGIGMSHRRSHPTLLLSVQESSRMCKQPGSRLIAAPSNMGELGRTIRMGPCSVRSTLDPSTQESGPLFVLAILFSDHFTPAEAAFLARESLRLK